MHPTVETPSPDTPHPIPHTPAPAGHTPRSDTLWDLAKRDYLAGYSGTQVCDRYGLSRRTFNDRAARGGWRRCDQPDPPPISDDDPEADEPVDCAALAEDALVRVRRALRHGRAGEAASWMRLHDKLTARLEAGREAERRRERVEQARGSAGAAGPLRQGLSLRDRMAVVSGAANLQMRMSAAYRRGQLLDIHLDRFSDLNYATIQALRELTEPPETDDGSEPDDPPSSPSNFSEDDDP